MIIKKAEEEAYEADRKSYDIKGAVKNREMGSVRYSSQLGGLLFWLHYGTRPNGLSGGDFMSLRKICEKLVEKKQLKPEALNIF